MWTTSLHHRRAPALAVLLCGACLVMLSASGCRKAVSAKPLQDGQPYQHTGRHFSVIFPAGWVVQENPEAKDEPAADPAPAETSSASMAPATASLPEAPEAVTAEPTQPTVSEPTHPSATSTDPAPPAAATTDPAAAVPAAAPEVNPEDGTSLLVVTAFKPGNTASISIEACNIGYEISLEEFAIDMEARKVASTVKDFARVETQDFVGKHPGRVVSYTGTRNGVPARGCAYYFITGKKGIIINGVANEQDFNVKTFNKVAASLSYQ